MSILDFLLIFGGLVIAFKCGEIYGHWIFYRVIQDYLDTKGISLKEELEKEEKQVQSPKLYKLETREENNMLYLYNRDTDSFICQAVSIDELAKSAKEVQNIKAAAVIHGNKVFLFMDGTAKEYT